MLRNDIPDRYITAGTCRGKHISSCLNLVRNDRILCGMQLLNTHDTDHIRTGAFDVRSHTVQEVRDVNHVRFLGTVLDYGSSFRHGSGHHDIDGSTDGHCIEEYMASLQRLRNRADASVLYRNLCTQCLEALQMQVDRS